MLRYAALCGAPSWGGSVTGRGDSTTQKQPTTLRYPGGVDSQSTTDNTAPTWAPGAGGALSVVSGRVAGL